MRQGSGRWIAASLMASAIAAAILAFANGAIGLHSIHDLQAWAAPLVQRHWLAACAIAFIICVTAYALSFPVAPLIGIGAGALFGFWPAVLILWPAQTIGSTFAFLAARHLLRGMVPHLFARRIAAFDIGGAHGLATLLSIRLNPLLPYWPVNLALGATRLPLAPFVATAAIGLLPATLAYAEAGTRLASLGSPGDIVSPALAGWLVLASLLPLLANRAARRLTPRSGLVGQHDRPGFEQ